MTEQRFSGRRFLDRLTARKALKILLLGALLVIVATFAVYAVPQLVGAEESYVVLSGSMQPTMAPGDVIIVDAVDVSAIEAGDIVTFETGSATVTTHRVVETVAGSNGPALRTKGDNNEEADPGLVSQSALVGRVMTVGSTPVVIPAIGHVIRLARTQIGQWLLFYLPLTLLILNEFYRRLGRSAADGGDTGPPAEPSTSTDGGVPLDIVAHAAAEGTSPDAHRFGAAIGSTVDPQERQDADGLTLSAASLRTPVAVLALLVVYTGWLNISAASALTIGVFAGSAVALALMVYARAGAEGAPVGPLTTEEIALTLPVLAVLVGTSGWLAVTRESVPSAMLAVGGGVAILLLGAIGLLLWWRARGTDGAAVHARGVDPGSESRGESSP
jgi:signal peptidase